MYKSDKVALALCGFGVATILVLSVRSCNEAEADEPPAVSTAVSYPNNHYVEGAGWYHASSGRFWPYMFNYYEPARGYYHDGAWWPSAGNPLAYSRPTYAGADEANTRYAATRSSSFSSSGGSGGSHSSVSGESHSSGSSSRGGFGSTGGGEGGGS